MKTSKLKCFFIALMAVLCTANANAQEKYGFKVGGVEVTSANYTDISASNGFTTIKDGTVTYDPSAKKLTIDNVVIEAEIGNAIKNESIEGLTIVLKGNNKLTSGWEALMCETTTVIDGQGSGKLTCTSQAGCGIIMIQAALTISRCEVTATGQWGISGETNDSKTHITVDNATVRAKGNGIEGSVCDIAMLTLTGCQITSPTGAAFEATLKGIAKDGALVKEEIIITPTQTENYGLQIGNIEVTPDNYTNISASNGFSAIKGGIITYDPSTKTLTLDNTVIENKEGNAVWNEDVENLTIVLKGNNVLTTSGAAFACSEPTVIDGQNSGKLTCTSEKNCGFYLNGAILTISRCDLTVTGIFGIAGYNGLLGEHLTIDNATVRAKGTRGSICDLASLTLVGCEIISPSGAAFDETQLGVALNGEVVKEEITIGNPTSVDSRTICPETEVSAVYTLDGRRINTLQRGINLVKTIDGKTRKVIVK